MDTRDLVISDIRLDALAGEPDVVLQMDEQAFRALYERTARPLWAYLARVCGDRQLADDLVQEVYYRFLRAEGTYENDAHRRNVLFRIATNLARDAHRRRRVRPPATAGDPDVALVPDRSDLAASLQRRGDLDRAMRHLTSRERSLLWLAYAEGSSHREIAAAVGVKLASVKLLLFRARKKLARVLGS